MNKLTSSLAILFTSQMTPIAVSAETFPRAEKIIDSLANPVFLTAPVNSTDALYILEKAGRIMIYESQRRNFSTFLKTLEIIMEAG